MLTLIFSMDKSIQSKVIDAFRDIHIDSPGTSGDPLVTANNLIGLTVGVTVEEMVSLEEMVKHLCKSGCLPDSVAMSLILISNRYREVKNDAKRNCPLSPKTRLVESKRAHPLDVWQNKSAVRQNHHHMSLTHSGKGCHSNTYYGNRSVEAHAGRTCGCNHPVALEYACTLLKEIIIDSSKPSSFKSVIGALLSVILNDNMPDSSWYGASTAAVDALVALSARPDQLGKI
ncbi:hypothetical protein BSKO_08985 [Bryopsis sp. KO-2023]|nr:hypothetical protein BSKO_08985 [Bryopsis sp. KO-2023]